MHEFNIEHNFPEGRKGGNCDALHLETYFFALIALRFDYEPHNTPASQISTLEIVAIAMHCGLKAAQRRVSRSAL